MRAKSKGTESSVSETGHTAPDFSGDAARYFTYMLRCADGTLYTGWTTDPGRRLSEHNRGTGAKYTRSRRPVELVLAEEAASKEEAMSREWHWKRLTRKEKEELIRIFEKTSRNNSGESVQ